MALRAASRLYGHVYCRTSQPALQQAGRLLETSTPFISRLSNTLPLHSGACYSNDAPNSKGTGGGPPTRSVDQAQASDAPGPARSPDAPADPLDHIHSHGANPTEAMRHASGKAHEAMSDNYNHPEQNIGPSYAAAAPEMAGRLVEKLGGVVGRAAQVVQTVAATASGKYDGSTVLEGTSSEGQASQAQPVEGGGGDAAAEGGPATRVEGGGDQGDQVGGGPGQQYQEAARRVSDNEEHHPA